MRVVGYYTRPSNRRHGCRSARRSCVSPSRHSLHRTGCGLSQTSARNWTSWTRSFPAPTYAFAWPWSPTYRSFPDHPMSGVLNLNPCRCHLTTVAGCATCRLDRQPFPRRESQTQKITDARRLWLGDGDLAQRDSSGGRLHLVRYVIMPSCLIQSTARCMDSSGVYCGL